MLDRIEAGYVRRVVVVELYDGSTQAAYVYQMVEGGQGPHGLPSERYLDIIIRGCLALPSVPRVCGVAEESRSRPSTRPYRPVRSYPYQKSRGGTAAQSCGLRRGGLKGPLHGHNGKVLRYVGERVESGCFSPMST